MQQLEQEKFGAKVQSHDTIFCLVFLSTCFCQTFKHRLVSYIHLTVWGELYCENSEKDWVILESKFKVGLCGNLTIQLTCATDAESRGNQTVNHNVWLHTVAITTMNSKVNEYLAIHLSTKMNETTIQNIVIKCSAIN